jgi:bacillithiol system protein YtxJ
MRSVTPYPAGTLPRAVAQADPDGDGCLDLGGIISPLVAAYFDGDGGADLLEVSPGAGQAWVLLGGLGGPPCSLTRYCTAKTNSQGAAAAIGASGLPSFGAQAFGLTPGGATPAAVATGMVVRSRRYPWWYRDPTRPDGTGVALSDGLGVAACPERRAAARLLAAMALHELTLEPDPEIALRAIQAASQERPVLVLKRSPICPVSHRAEDELEAFLSGLDPTRELAIARIDVIEQRPLARGLTAELHVQHESPQALWFASGELVWHGSHGALTRERFATLLGRAP